MATTDRAAWMKDCRWGIFTHYLADIASATEAVDLTIDDWNRQVDSFDTERLADQLASTGCGYYGITLGQNSGFYCSPNSAFDSIVGRTPSRCSTRDLPMDLYEALSRKGIRLMLYLPSGAPDNDGLAMEKLEWTNGNGPKGPKRLESFQAKWEMVIREWSLRYGDRVSAWWIDGCYFAKAMYDHPEEPNFQSLTGALRAGNPHAAVALNPGIALPIRSISPLEDFTAGELDSALAAYDIYRTAPEEGKVDGVRFHAFTFLGKWWGCEPPRFPDALVAGYTEYVNSLGGAMTWDVPISKDGRIPEAFLRQLSILKR